MFCLLLISTRVGHSGFLESHTSAGSGPGPFSESGQVRSGPGRLTANLSDNLSDYLTQAANYLSGHERRGRRPNEGLKTARREPEVPRPLVEAPLRLRPRCHDALPLHLLQVEA